jgi:hypothetical protein
VSRQEEYCRPREQRASLKCRFTTRSNSLLACASFGPTSRSHPGPKADPPGRGWSPPNAGRRHRSRPACRGPGELDPGRPAAQVDGIWSATDDQVGVEARHFLLEPAQPGGHHLGTRAVHSDSARHELSISTVFVLEGYQNPRLGCPSSYSVPLGLSTAFSGMGVHRARTTRYTLPPSNQPP